MRKFTSFLFFMLLAMGAMAQTPVVSVSEIGTAPYKLSDEDAAKIFELDNLTIVLDVTTGSSFSDRGAFFCVADPEQPVPSSFSGTNTSYMACGHNGAAIAYIASAKSGQHFSTSSIPTSSSIRLAFVLDKTNNKFKAYIGDTNTNWTMDRNFGSYEIATPKMVKEDFENANIYIGGGMAGGVAQELADATIHGVRVYSGTLTINEIKALPKMYVQGIFDFENGQILTFVTSRGWMGAKEGNDNVISTAKTAHNLTGSKEDVNFQWTVYKSEQGKYYLYNLGKQMFMGVQSANNTSVPFAATPQTKRLTFKKSSLAAYPIMFSTDNAGVVNHSPNHGDGLITWTGGWNTLNDGGSSHKVEIVGTLNEETLARVAGLVADYESSIPAEGKYYTFKNGDYYITSGVTNDRIAMSTAEDATAIYYFDGSHLLAYTTGLYFGLNGNDWTFESVGSNNISEIEFCPAVNGAEGKCNIKSGGRWLHRTDGYVNRCSANTCGDAHNFSFEEVESLPVSITSAGYATLYAPVALEIADDVKAYTVAIVDGKYASMKEIESGVIPANTGVILKGDEGTYDFVITTTTETVDTELAGTVAATYITEDAYVLGIVDEEVGLYTATKNQQEGAAWKNNSHKAYLPAPVDANGIASYSFNFDWNGTTGVENIESAVNNAENGKIYDITGRTIKAITAPGIYIVNGKKVVVK